MADPRFKDPIVVLSSIGGVEIDVVDRMDENYEHIITQNPTEQGVPVTDNITNLPIKINIEGGFSDIKISNLLGTVFSPQNAIRGRAKTEFDRLLTLFAELDTFNVMDGFHFIKDMQFKSLRAIKDKEGYAISFAAELWQIIKVNTDPSQQTIIDRQDAFTRTLVAVQLLRSIGSITPEFSPLETLGILA
jgi:hypothetical protein